MVNFIVLLILVYMMNNELVLFLVIVQWLTLDIVFLLLSDIHTGAPVNTFVFLRPLLQSLEYDMPTASLAVPHALLLGKFFWALYTIMYPWLNKWWLPEPLMLPTEVHKVCFA